MESTKRDHLTSKCANCANTNPETVVQPIVDRLQSLNRGKSISGKALMPQNNAWKGWIKRAKRRSSPETQFAPRVVDLQWGEKQRAKRRLLASLQSCASPSTVRFWCVDVYVRVWWGIVPPICGESELMALQFTTWCVPPRTTATWKWATPSSHRESAIRIPSLQVYLCTHSLTHSVLLTRWFSQDFQGGWIGRRRQEEEEPREDGREAAHRRPCGSGRASL
jgi:hypothetical protein